MTTWLVTWLWQGLVLALIVAASLRSLRFLNAATRHLIWNAALLALAWLGAVSSPYYGEPTAPVMASESAGPVFYVPTAPDLMLDVLLGVWAAVALVQLLRLPLSLHRIHALRDQSQPIDPAIEADLPLWLDAKGKGRGAELVVCDAVPGATLLGFFWPCIALPSCLIESLTRDELDQVVLHEYAHVQRRDDWARLGQAMLQPVLWIHPVAAFIAQAMNLEREVACDDWVIARTGRAKAYARCLAHAAGIRARTPRCEWLAPALFGGRCDLARRVDRLLLVRAHIRRTVSIPVAAVSACTLVILVTQLRTVPLVSEIVATALPYVARPAASGTTRLVSPEPPRASARLSTVRQTTLANTSAVDNRPAPSGGIVRVERGEPLEPAEPTELHELYPSLLSARSFTGTYEVPAESASSTAPRGWQRVGSAGAQIGQAAQLAGAGVANAFGRAGVSLAKRF